MPDTNDIAASLAADLARMQSETATWGEPAVAVYDWPHWCGDYPRSPKNMWPELCEACFTKIWNERNPIQITVEDDEDDDDSSSRTQDELDEQRDAGIYNAIGAYRDEGASDPRL